MVIGEVAGKREVASGIMFCVSAKEIQAKSPFLGLQIIITMACLFSEWQKCGSKVPKN